MKFKLLSVLLCSASLFACSVEDNGNKVSGTVSSDADIASLMSPEEVAYFGLGAMKSAQSFIEKADVTEKRKSNVESALARLREVKALPNKGLMQANAKCTKISETVKYLKDTNSPARPFAGLRQKFRRSLHAERVELLKANGVKSCGAVYKLVASLPPSAPEPTIAADEAPPAADAIDPEVTGQTIIGVL